MSKAVLVIDMPESCFHCKLHDWLNCRIIKGCHTGNTRPDWCPLKEMPEILVHEPGESVCVKRYKTGWNRCINTILGEN